MPLRTVSIGWHPPKWGDRKFNVCNCLQRFWLHFRLVKGKPTKTSYRWGISGILAPKAERYERSMAQDYKTRCWNGKDDKILEKVKFVLTFYSEIKIKKLAEKLDLPIFTRLTEDKKLLCFAVTWNWPMRKKKGWHISPRILSFLAPLVYKLALTVKNSFKQEAPKYSALRLASVTLWI